VTTRKAETGERGHASHALWQIAAPTTMAVLASACFHGGMYVLRGLVTLLALSALVASTMGCADTEIRVEAYSQTCESGADCIIVAFGDACDACLTDLQPVSAGELDAIRADVDAAAATCAPWDGRNTSECVAPVPTQRPVCDDGQCVNGTEPCAPDDVALCRGSDE
jgi:hypothetical protein